VWGHTTGLGSGLRHSLIEHEKTRRWAARQRHRGEAGGRKCKRDKKKLVYPPQEEKFSDEVTRRGFGVALAGRLSKGKR